MRHPREVERDWYLGQIEGSRPLFTALDAQPHLAVKLLRHLATADPGLLDLFEDLELNMAVELEPQLAVDLIKRLAENGDMLHELETELDLIKAELNETN